MGDREAAVGATILSYRSPSVGEAKWWGPAVLDAPVPGPSSLKVREPRPLPRPMKSTRANHLQKDFPTGSCLVHWNPREERERGVRTNSNAIET
jgi:hypothetical protein